MTLFKRFKSRLSLKIGAIFVVSAIAFLLILSIGIGGGFKQHFATQVKPHIDHYTQYISQDIGNPPNYQRAKILATQLNTIIKIKTPDKVWSSDDNINLPEHNMQRHFGNRPKHFFSVQNGTTQFFFIQNRNTPYEDSNGFWLIIALAMFVFWLSHYFISKQFRPIKKEIKTGLSEISKGNLSHRIKLNRQDEIGTLAHDINAMTTQIEKLLQSKQDLLLAVSHELRSPLTRSKLSLEMLEDSATKLSLQEDIRELEHIINDILDAQRLHTDHAILHKTKINVTTLIDDMLHTHFTDKAIAIQCDPQLPDLSLDASRITLMLKNLLDNALRYNRPEFGDVQLHVSYYENTLTMIVKDYGEGIKASDIERLTTAFYRPDHSRTRTTGGLGLGLYLCDGIAKAHGGHLTISSVLGEGATFTVALPSS